MEHFSRAAAADLMTSDFNDLKMAASNLFDHAIKLGGIGGFGSNLLQWVASFAAIYLLILDRTNWRTNMLTSLLVPYIFLTFPTFLFNIFRGQIGSWIAFVAVIIRLFLPQYYNPQSNSTLSKIKEWFELPATLVIILVVAPNLIAGYVRGGLIGTIICLVIGCYLLQEHLRASGGFKKAFSKSSDLSNSIGILLLFIYPVWALVFYIL
jgi:hypothetical protein